LAYNLGLENQGFWELGGNKKVGWVERFNWNFGPVKVWVENLGEEGRTFFWGLFLKFQMLTWETFHKFNPF